MSVAPEFPPTLVMVAPNGGRRSKADHPNLPLTTAEIVAEAEACHAAGAAALHLHVRDGDGRHVLDADLYRQTLSALARALGDKLLVQITTEQVGRYQPRQQMEVVRAVRPDAASLAVRELVPDEAAVPAAASFYEELERAGIGAQHILYSVDDIRWLRSLERRGVIPRRPTAVLLVLGRYGEQSEPDPAALLKLLPEIESDRAWMSCSFGWRECAVALTSAGLGGHSRVGFENNLHRWDGRRAESNADLVGQVVRRLQAVGRSPARVELARVLLAGG